MLEPLLKKTPTQEFSCCYYNIFKNTYFEKHLRAAASKTSGLHVYSQYPSLVAYLELTYYSCFQHIYLLENLITLKTNLHYLVSLYSLILGIVLSFLKISEYDDSGCMT